MDGNEEHEQDLAVLLVEDNPDHAELISRCLEEDDIGARLYHVSDGEEALDFLERRGLYQGSDRSPRPNLIFMDLRLPKLDGLSLLRTIKGHTSFSSIPVVVLTTSTADPDIEGAYAARANAYVAKPLNFEEFKMHLQTATRFWLQCNRIPRVKTTSEPAVPG